MHPAPSIIVFTTLSGLGYGLAAMLGLGLFDPGAVATKLAYLAALALIGTGLLSSTLHLANPQRAWRAFSQWRSSWLSREGVMAVVTFLPLAIVAWATVIDGRHLRVAGLIATGCAAATIYCTAMIYASLKSIDAWHTWLTPLCYLLFGAAGGMLLGGLVAAAGAGPVLATSISGAALLALAWGAKAAWWRRIRTLQPLSSPESATGLGAIGRVRLLERPHSNDNYLTREMGYRIARKHAVKLSRLALLLGGVAPAVLLLLVAAVGQGWAGGLLQLVAVSLFGTGIAVERWLFFAEARHAVMNYY